MKYMQNSLADDGTPLLQQNGKSSLKCITSEENDGDFYFPYGTLERDCYDNVAEAVIQNGVDKAWFSAFNMPSSAVRNVNCWLRRYDTSGIAVWNTYDNSKKRKGVVVTPRHVYQVAHYWVREGKKLYFIDPDNNVIERTAQEVQRDGERDVAILLLDSDLPPSIKPIRLFDVDVVFDNDRPIKTPDVPSFFINQQHDVVCGMSYLKHMATEHNACHMDWQTFDPNTPAGRAYRTPKWLPSEFQYDVADGDSGSPVMTIVTNGVGIKELALLGAMQAPGNTYTSLLCNNGVLDLREAIDRQIARVDAKAGISTGYTAGRITPKFN